MNIRGATNLMRFCRKFGSNDSGNFAMLFALFVPLILALAGGAITLQDLVNHKHKLQNHADIISLAAVKESAYNGAKKKSIRELAKTYSSHELKENEKCRLSNFEKPGRNAEQRTSVTVHCEGQLESFFSNFIGEKRLSYSAYATSTIRIPQAVDIAFVFDVSESMDGNEIAELKNGLETLVNARKSSLQNPQVSLIPFSNTVRLGARFENFVDKRTGYDNTGNKYSGCFDRLITDPTIKFERNSSYNLVPEYRTGSSRRHCPDQRMEALFHVEASSWDVKNLIDNISVSYGTGSGDALVWGYRALDPKFNQILSGSSTSKSEKFRHLIFMTDGKPLDAPYEKNSEISQEDIQKQSLRRFSQYCNTLPFDKKRISVHIINYNNHLDKDNRTALQDCIKGEGRFYDINSNELEETMSSIMGEIEDLRLKE